MLRDQDRAFVHRFLDRARRAHGSALAAIVAALLAGAASAPPVLAGATSAPPVLAGATSASDATAALLSRHALSGEEYVCPPCSTDCHERTWSAPGACDVCGMQLVARTSMRRVAILLWDGVELLDFAGPGEVFAAARGPEGEAFDVYTVAATSDPITSQGFVRVVPGHALEDAPMPDLLIVPGGDMRGAIADERIVAWVREAAAEADAVMSVCTGAFLLAEAGLLDGLEATTWHGALDALEREAPKTRVVRDRRFVDNGKIVTCAGVSAGIDGALHVVARLCGEPSAAATARYMEYDWRPAPGDAPWRTALAHGARGELDQALVALEAALAAGFARPSAAMTAPELDALRRSPRHRARWSAAWAAAPRESSVAVASATEPGVRLVLAGRVVDATSGEPVPGAVVHLYHTDDRGLYADEGGNENPRLFGHLAADAEGRFDVRTIVPASYPESEVTRHVHYTVEAVGYRTTTSECVFSDDPLLTPERRARAIADGWPVVELAAGGGGAKRGELVIVLARED